MDLCFPSHNGLSITPDVRYQNDISVSPATEQPETMLGGAWLISAIYTGTTSTPSMREYAVWSKSSMPY